MRRLIPALLLVSAAFGGGLLAGASVVQGARASARDAYAGLDTLARVLNTIEARYVEPVETDDLLYGAVRGMVRELDPWSVFLGPAEWADLQDHADGTLDGVGLQLARADDGALRVTELAPGGPADRAGVRVGAHLLAIDGVPTDAQPLSEVRAALAGARGELVTLDLDQGAGRQRVPVIRERYEEQVVTASRHGDTVRLRISHFSRATRTQLDAAWTAHADPPPTAIILDLRGNPGGLMDQAAAVVDRFVGDGLAVESRGRDGVVLDRHPTTTTPDDLDLPMVVLVDEGSASAAEVVAGALRDRERATLVGRTTYGKGTVQHVFELEDGSALKLTLARYHLPSGASIPDRRGLTPDVVVPQQPGDAAAALRAEVRSAGLSPRQERDLIERIDEALPAPTGPDPAPATDPFLEAAWATLAAR